MKSLKNKDKKQWFENEEFWIRFAPIMFDTSRWEEAPIIAEQIVRIAELGKNCSVLDAGCGSGRISVELAARGLAVTGVDIIQSELDAAIDSVKAEGVKAEFIRCDLRHFKSKRKFDAAVNLFTSFGYCDTVDEDFLILKNIAASIKKGGTFIIECTSREVAIIHFTEGEEFERNGFFVKTQFSVSGAWEGLVSKWSLTDKTGFVYSHEFTQRLYSATDFVFLLKKVGFTVVKIYGDFDFNPYNQHARTMVAVAKK